MPSPVFEGMISRFIVCKEPKRALLNFVQRVHFLQVYYHEVTVTLI